MINILHIIPYDTLYPPKNGGALRCFNIADQLSSFANLHVLSYQQESEIINRGYRNPKVVFFDPSSFPMPTDIFDFFPKSVKPGLKYRWYQKTFKGPAAQTFLDFRHILKQLSKNNSYDYIILEHLETICLSKLLRTLFPDAKIIFDAHNIDHKLTERGTRFYSTLKSIESSLYKFADTIWACSNIDKDELYSLNNSAVPVYTVPNGVESQKKFLKDKASFYNNLLFCGSLDYAPNRDGLIWFYDKIWPAIVKAKPECRLTIIGRGDTNRLEQLKSDSRINFIGEVTSVEPFYETSFIAIVPILKGSGTRLKITEAMSFGNPVVSTKIGAEGIDLINNKHAKLVSSGDEFIKATLELLNNPEEGERLRYQARQLIDEKYSWDKIGSNIKQMLHS